MTLTTNDYSLFTIHPLNRETDDRKVRNLMEGIKKIGYFEEFPIMVTEDFQIFDGAHRFEACRRLNLPVYYAIPKLKCSVEETIISLDKNQSTWTLYQYLDLHAKKGKQCYKDLLRFNETYKLGIYNSVTICLGGNYPTTNLVRGDEFTFHIQYMEILDFILYCKPILEFALTSKFVHAVEILIKKALLPKEIARVRNKIDSLQQKAKMSEYLLYFQNILCKNKKYGQYSIITLGYNQ